MIINQNDVEKYLVHSSFYSKLKPIFGFNFDGLNQPAAVYIGCNFGNEYNIIYEIFKSYGFRVAPHNASAAVDIKNIIVSPNGIKLPFMPAKDLLKTAIRICEVVYRHGRNVTGMISPITKDALSVPLIKETLFKKRTDILKAYSENPHYDHFFQKSETTIYDFVQQQINLAKNMPAIDMAALDKKSLYRGCSWGNAPYAVTSQYCKSVAYFSPQFNAAIPFARGLSINNVSYGFIHECAINQNQLFYGNCGIERMGKLTRIGQKNILARTYETAGYAYRNPYKATYLCLFEGDKPHIVKITDKQGRWLSEQWKIFSELIPPFLFKTEGIGSYEFLRMKKEYTTVKESSSFKPTGYREVFPCSIKKLSVLNLVCQTCTSLQDLDLSDYASVILPRGLEIICNIKFPPMPFLDLSSYENIRIENIDFSNIKELVLPKHIALLRNCKLPKMERLDLSNTKIIEHIDLRNAKKVLLSGKIKSLRDTQLPEMNVLDLHSANNILLDKSDFRLVKALILPREIHSAKRLKLLPSTEIYILTKNGTLQKMQNELRVISKHVCTLQKLNNIREFGKTR